MVHDIPSIKKWTKNVDLFDCDVVLIPVHLVDHWCLCVVESKAKDITYFDSQGGRNSLCLESVLKYLTCEHQWKSRAGPFGQWNMRHASNIGRQPNWWDCGVFVCHYARMVAEGQEVTASIDWLTTMREHMVHEILSGCLQERSAIVSV
ncbi:hypothetical protein FOCC_FOCC014271 [Frankliniella occidentalis]|nr:hypothetical protein FOCC_FOCC014271 [Frankliniella occidentalis]